MEIAPEWWKSFWERFLSDGKDQAEPDMLDANYSL